MNFQTNQYLLTNDRLQTILRQNSSRYIRAERRMRAGYGGERRQLVPTIIRRLQAG